MNDNLEQLQKRLMGDGPAEKQVLLLKLLHEFETAPHFGQQYLIDADCDPQRWIARVGALLARVSIERKISFQTTQHMMTLNWSDGRERLRQQLLGAAEDIKLELELDGHDSIGQVYGPQQQYNFLRDLKEIILGARQEVFVVDAYFDGKAFDTYLAPLGISCSVRILCNRYSSDVAGHLSAFETQYGRRPHLRKSKGMHDRLVIIDGTDCWIVGGSIKDAGKLPTYLVPLQPSISATKISIYENMWEEATPV